MIIKSIDWKGKAYHLNEAGELVYDGEINLTKENNMTEELMPVEDPTSEQPKEEVIPEVKKVEEPVAEVRHLDSAVLSELFAVGEILKIESKHTNVSRSFRVTANAGTWLTLQQVSEEVK